MERSGKRSGLLTGSCETSATQTLIYEAVSLEQYVVPGGDGLGAVQPGERAAAGG